MRIPSVPKPLYEVVLRKNGDLVKSEFRYSAYAAKHLKGVWQESYGDAHTVDVKSPQENTHESISRNSASGSESHP